MLELFQMNILGNNEILTYLFLALIISLVMCIIGLIFKQFGPKMQEWLDIKIKKWSDQCDKKRELLEEEYRTYSTDDLLEVLKKIHFKGTSHNYAIFQVLSTKVDDTRIIERVQQLQGAIDPQTRMNANYVMTHYFESQYTDYTTEKLLDLLQCLEDRNEQEVHALFVVALTRIEDNRVRQYIHQLLCSTDRKIKFNAEFMIKEYFEKQNTNDTTEDMLDLLQTLENRDKQEIDMTLNIASARMQDQRVSLCIEQLQNSKNRLVREQAKQIMNDYMA